MTSKSYKDLTEDQMWELFDNIDLDNDLDLDLVESINGTETQENTEKNKNSHLCSNCNSDSLVNDSSMGHYVCQDCGVVQNEYLDKNPEYNNYEDSSNQGSNRCGCPTNYFFPKASLGTKLKQVIIVELKYCTVGDKCHRERSLLSVLEQIQEM